jgi:hypothetical protein
MIAKISQGHVFLREENINECRERSSKWADLFILKQRRIGILCFTTNNNNKSVGNIHTDPKQLIHVTAHKEGNEK